MQIQKIPGLPPNQILLSNQFPSNRRPENNRVHFHFGSWIKKVDIQYDKHISENTIGLPANFSRHITIPSTIPYELFVDGPHIHVGPVIAFMVSRKKLTTKLLDYYRVYVSNCHNMKGLIYICSLNEINIANKTVQGYYYNPVRANRGKDPWEKGNFPYPGALYRKIRLINDIRYNDLSERVGNKIFNSINFNKLQLKDCLTSDPQMREHLPDTAPLNNLQVLNKMLSLYGSVYLKPVKGSFGSGITKVDRMRSRRGYIFIHRNGTKTVVNKKRMVEKLVRHLTNSDHYLIQQSVAFISNNKHMDFRVIMQKDGNEIWKCSGIIARFGKEGRIYTNDISTIQLGRVALRTTFQLDDDQASNKEQEIISICKQACIILEKFYGNYGDLGIDVIVDKALKVWLLEVNCQHQPEIAAPKENPQMFYTVITRPFEYARALAGFTKEKTIFLENQQN